MINKRKFYRFIEEYKPMRWEEFDKSDNRFDLEKKYVNYLMKNRCRYYVTLKHAVKHFPHGKMSVLDLGTYPGTLLRVLKGFFPGRRMQLYGAGLNIVPGFAEDLKEKSDAEIMRVNLDPKNPQFKNKDYPERIPLPDGSIDFVFALEVIEHLTSPTHMLDEIRRVLKKSGLVLITTPNVTRIGSVFKLLAGRSNYDRLIPLDYDREDDEWRPHFREYDMKELTDLLAKFDLEMMEKKFYNFTNTKYDVKTVKSVLAEVFKSPFYCIPHFRDSILVVAQKK